MNIALIAHDRKKELMVQFCMAYCGILAKHNICATGTTGKFVEEATGLNPMSNAQYEPDVHAISRLCDMHNIPIATNSATAEMLILGLDRGDLDWRNIVNPKNKK